MDRTEQIKNRLNSLWDNHDWKKCSINNKNCNYEEEWRCDISRQLSYEEDLLEKELKGRTEMRDEIREWLQKKNYKQSLIIDTIEIEMDNDNFLKLFDEKFGDKK